MNTPILQLREKKKDIVLILAIAIFLALAINFFTFFVAEYFDGSSSTFFYFCILSFFIALFLLKHVIFSDTDQIIRIRGAIAYNIENGAIDPIQIMGYRFNRDFCEYLSGFVHENRAYFKILSDNDKTVEQMSKFQLDNLTHHTIINSVIEFMILYKIQLHLNRYFVENEIDTDSIVRLTRRELSAEVLKNRVIDQITKDMKERQAFSSGVDSDADGVVTYSQGDGGAIYQRLELELPPNSRIARNSDGFIVIENPLYNITIMPKYEGFGTVLSEYFLAKFDHLFALKLVSLNLHIQIKRTAFITGKSLKMYEWLDSLIEDVSNYMSTDRLMQRLDSDLVEMLKVAVTNSDKDVSSQLTHK